MTSDDLDKLGRLADRLDNAAAATLLPISPILAVDGMKGIVEAVRDELKAFVIEKGGVDPWELQP